MESARKRIIDILSRCREMTLATVSPDGSPHATVVSYVHDGLLVYFSCSPESDKVEHITGERRVSATITAPFDRWSEIKGLSFAGEASGVTTAREKELVARLMAERFAELSRLNRTMLGRVRVFRVRPYRVSILDYSRGFGHTEIVAIDAAELLESRGSLLHDWAPIGEP